MVLYCVKSTIHGNQAPLILDHHTQKRIYLYNKQTISRKKNKFNLHVSAEKWSAALMWLILQIFAFHTKSLMWIPYCHLFAFYAKAFMWPPLKFLHFIRTSNIHKWGAWCILFFFKKETMYVYNQTNKQTK